MERLLLYNKDIRILTGKNEKACYRLIRKIREKVGKPPHIPITIEEFCEYTRLRIEVVREILKK